MACPARSALPPYIPMASFSDAAPQMGVECNGTAAELIRRPFRSATNPSKNLHPKKNIRNPKCPKFQIIINIKIVKSNRNISGKHGEIVKVKENLNKKIKRKTVRIFLMFCYIQWIFLFFCVFLLIVVKGWEKFWRRMVY